MKKMLVALMAVLTIAAEVSAGCCFGNCGPDRGGCCGEGPQAGECRSVYGVGQVSSCRRVQCGCCRSCA